MKDTSTRYAPRKPRRQPSKSLTVASLSALALLAIGLSGAALTLQGAGAHREEAGDERVRVTPNASNDESESAHESPAANNATDNPGSENVIERFLAVSEDPERLIRAAGTGCESTVTVEVSSDGGATWIDADTSTLAIAGIRGLKFDDGERANLAYVDNACELQIAHSYVYGGAWEKSTTESAIWAFGDDSRSGDIVVSGLVVASPCLVADIAGVDKSGIVLCDDGSVSVTNDAGDSWTDPVAVPGARAVATDLDGFSVLSVNSDGCTGLSVRQFERQGLGQAGECAIMDVPSNQVAIASGGGSLYVWVSDELLQSDDRGRTWN